MRDESILDSFRYYSGAHNHARYSEINQSYRGVLKKTSLWNQKISEVGLLSTVIGQGEYLVDFSSFRSSTPDRAYIKESASEVYYEMQEVGGQIFEQNRPSTDTGVITSAYYDSPILYKLTGDTTYNFSLTPKPDKVYTIRFDGVAKIIDLDKGVTPITPENYDEALAIKAASIYLKQKGDATQQDLNKSAALREEAENELKSLYIDFNKNRMTDLNWDPQPMAY